MLIDCNVPKKDDDSVESRRFASTFICSEKRKDNIIIPVAITIFISKNTQQHVVYAVCMYS